MSTFKSIFAVALLGLLCVPTFGQDAGSLKSFIESSTQSTATAHNPIEVNEAAVGDNFHREFIRAVVKARRVGKIKPIEAARLRVAMISPAFREHAEELAILQMSASGGGDVLPRSDDGTIDRPRIDWEAFAEFLERIIPLILQLIQAFASADVEQTQFLVACIDAVCVEYGVAA